MKRRTFDMLVFAALALFFATMVLAGRDRIPARQPDAGPCAAWANVSPTSYGACLQKEGVK